MSSSSHNYISVADSVEDIEKKCQKAFCPPEVEDNPILQILQYHIFPGFPVWWFAGLTSSGATGSSRVIRNSRKHIGRGASTRSI